MSDRRQNVRSLPGVDERVESGAIQFGDDWPGLFLRGDTALLGLRPLLRRALEDGPQFRHGFIRGLLDLLDDVEVK